MLWGDLPLTLLHLFLVLGGGTAQQEGQGPIKKPSEPQTGSETTIVFPDNGKTSSYQGNIVNSFQPKNFFESFFYTADFL